MKYIRTDGNVIISYDENVDKLDQPFILTQPSHIINQADTLEELCDEFVVKYFNKVEQRNKYLHLERFKEFNNYCWNKDDEYYIYGAIWTKKGLVYVAKMNEKGELELL